MVIKITTYVGCNQIKELVVIKSCGIHVLFLLHVLLVKAFNRNGVGPTHFYSHSLIIYNYNRGK